MVVGWLLAYSEATDDVKVSIFRYIDLLIEIKRMTLVLQEVSNNRRSDI